MSQQYFEKEVKHRIIKLHSNNIKIEVYNVFHSYNFFINKCCCVKK